MPTLKAIHICNSHQPKLKPKIAKEYVSPTLNPNRNRNIGIEKQNGTKPAANTVYKQ
ncbi:hypothetical protein SAMN05421636_103481 [Pricia antarctica]|jgi:hypothetical protein|uniref:Uncharacterized protein n=2 Tax=Bacteroidota TaxID=976 RepID=A0A1G7AQ45_9FLAO|nr:hypothetical protein C8N25_1346 [Algoriphagus antarcticus]SDE16810.1 hypothetical protein SAMN05421636_103481 [Pricia antarctica]